MTDHCDRDAILEKFIALLQETALLDGDDDAFEDGGTFEIENDGPDKDGEKKPGPKKPKPVVVKKKTISRKDAEEIARALQQLFNRARREAGQPCCANMLVPIVSGITVERKLPNGTFESPVNGLFDANDTIKVTFSILACPVMDIRVDLVDQSDQSSTRVLSLDKVGRGADLAADPTHPNDPGSHRFSKEIDLSQSQFSISASPARIALTISVRDSCPRIAAGSILMTFVDIG